MLNNPTKKRLLINIVLVCGLLLLAIAIWLSPDKTIQKRLFDGLDANSITKIRIENSSVGSVTIAQIDEHWEITEPIKITANSFRIASILNITQEVSHSKYDLSSIDPVELGFDGSKPSLCLNDLLIQFGDKDPIDGRRYTQFQDNVHLIEDRYLPIISSKFESLIDTQILPEHMNITKYQLADYMITQTENGGWAIHPEDSSIGADQIQEWVNRWRRQRSSKTHYQIKMGKDSVSKITLKSNNKDAIIFKIIKSDKWSGLYFENQNIGYELSEAALEPLLSRPGTENTE